MLGLPTVIGSSTPIISTTLANSSTQTTISSLFSLDAWQSSITKFVNIPSNVVLGSTNPSLPALTTGANMGGQLILQNYGSIQGAGGALNSGAGGSAFRIDATTAAGSNFILLNYGSIYAGGGGGGQGGTGGGGYYYTYQTITEGPYLSESSPYYYYRNFPSNSVPGSSAPSYVDVWWDGVEHYVSDVYTVAYNENTTFANGAILTRNYTNSTYYDGSVYTYILGNDSGANFYYYISRTHVQTNTNYTSGGSGGSGGVGQGYGQNLTSGSSGSGGGSNAGSGGSGGNGGNWGSAGASGAAGTSGNYTGPTNGGAGGSAGYSIVNRSKLILYNYGSIIGSTYN